MRSPQQPSVAVSRMDNAGEWVLIERMDRDAGATIVWKGRSGCEWSHLSKLTRDNGISERVVRSLVASFSRPPRSFDHRERGPLFNTIVPVRGEDTRLVGHHVVAGGDMVVGLLLWIGPAASTAYECRPRSAGLIWSSADYRVSNNKDTFALQGDPGMQYADLDAPDQLFARVLRFPNLVDVIELVNAPPAAPTKPLRGYVTLLHDSLALLNLHFVAKRVGDRVCGLALDVSQWDPAEMDPLTAVHSRGLSLTDVSRAVLAFHPAAGTFADKPSIVYWVTAPPQEIAFWTDAGPTSRAGNPLIHPSSEPALLSARARIEQGSQREVVPITLRGHSDWIEFSIALSPYPGLSSLIYLAELRSGRP